MIEVTFFGSEAVRGETRGKKSAAFFGRESDKTAYRPA